MLYCMCQSDQLTIGAMKCIENCVPSTPLSEYLARSLSVRIVAVRSTVGICGMEWFGATLPPHPPEKLYALLETVDHLEH